MDIIDIIKGGNVGDIELQIMAEIADEMAHVEAFSGRQVVNGVVVLVDTEVR